MAAVRPAEASVRIFIGCYGGIRKIGEGERGAMTQLSMSVDWIDRLSLRGEQLTMCLARACFSAI